ncbi:MAG: ATP-binding cassette domain-containing protein [Clostridiales bacterium]|nr:ATP-binding cassette domain-containing protein [Clostridiales bacterium]
MPTSNKTNREYRPVSSGILPEHGSTDENGREILLSVKNIDITFGSGDTAVRAVKNASFDIYKGETFSLVGESGSGKTTIGRAVIRVNPLAAGEIQYKGTRISGKISRALDREVIRNIQMVFQDPAASLNERATVDYIVSEGLYNFHLYEDDRDREQKVKNIIREVGLLPEHLTRYPHEFSGGQRQRIGLARAMVMEPELVIADEPISALDVSIRAQVLNLMKKFQDEKGITYLFIAHDLSIVRFVSDRIGVIYKGNIVEVADAAELFDYPLHPYTHSLISAVPIPDPQLEKNKVPYVYDPTIHDYSEDEPEFVCIGHGHWVWGNKKEIETYREIREKGEPILAITISRTGVGRGETDDRQVILDKAEQDFLKAPVHDTGNILYGVLSFVIPILGAILAVVFRKNLYIRNYKVCKKGAVAGLIFYIIIAAVFLILLALVMI